MEYRLPNAQDMALKEAIQFFFLKNPVIPQVARVIPLQYFAGRILRTLELQLLISVGPPDV